MTKYKKNVVKLDRKPFQTALTQLHLGPDATWDKATYDAQEAQAMQGDMPDVFKEFSF